MREAKRGRRTIKRGRRTIELGGPERSPRVLVVDDDSGVRSAVRDFLHDEGFNVASAADGLDALKILRTGPHADVIVLDIIMPRMDGWDFRAAQLDDPALREIPVVVLTASGFVPDTIRRQLNTFSVIAKPLDLDPFLKAVRDACGLAGPEQSPSSSV
jgi:CheY-like chemotaxis protein